MDLLEAFGLHAQISWSKVKRTHGEPYPGTRQWEKYLKRHSHLTYDAMHTPRLFASWALPHELLDRVERTLPYTSTYKLRKCGSSP